MLVFVVLLLSVFLFICWFSWFAVLIALVWDDWYLVISLWVVMVACGLVACCYG